MTTKKTINKKAPIKKTAAKKPLLKKSITAKVAAKKVTPNTKAPTPQKTVAKKKQLVIASGETAFWVSDGQIIDSLITLQQVLDNVSEDVFTHHVTRERNDFATWVEAVLIDRPCAEALKLSTSSAAASKIVAKHLKLYRI